MTTLNREAHRDPELEAQLERDDADLPLGSYTRPNLGPTSPLSVRVNDSAIAEVDAIAEELGVNRGILIRAWIQAGITQHRAADEETVDDALQRLTADVDFLRHLIRRTIA